MKRQVNSRASFSAPVCTRAGVEIGAASRMLEAFGKVLH